MRKIFFFSFLLSSVLFGQLTILKPLKNAVYQRNNGNVGFVEVEGIAQSGVTSVEVRFVSIAGGSSTNWINLALQNGYYNERIGHFGGWYNVEMRSTKNGTVQTQTINKVGIGENFLVAGQSNVLNFGPDATDSRVSSVRLFYASNPEATFEEMIKSDFQKYYFPTGFGAFQGRLGDHLVQKWNVPVMFMTAGVGGSKIQEWTNSTKNGGEPYALINTIIDNFSNTYGLRAILWQQGESNAVEEYTAKDTYLSALKELILHSRGKIANIPWVVAKVSWAKNISGPNAQDINTLEKRNNVRQAQSEIVSQLPYVFEGPDCDLVNGYIGSENRADGVHLTVAGHGKIGALWSEKLNDHFLANSVPFVPSNKSVAKYRQNINFEQIRDVNILSEKITLKATSSSGLPINYSISAKHATLNGSEIILSKKEDEIFIQASQSGNDVFYAADPVSQTIRITKIAQNIDVSKIDTSDPKLVKIEAKATSNLNLTFEIAEGSGKVEGSNIIINKPGIFKINITQAGSEYYQTATKQVSFTINKAKQIIENPAFENREYNGQPLVFKATTSSGLKPIYQLVSGEGSISNDTLMVKKPSRFIIKITQPGNDFFLAAESLAFGFEVLKKSQTISFKNIENVYTDSKPFKIEASSDAKLPLSYELLKGPVKLNGNEISLLGTDGQVEIQILQNGDDFYLPAPKQTIGFSILNILGLSPYQSLLFPNPTNGSIYLEISGLEQITVLNSDGRTVPFQLSTIQADHYKIDLLNLSSGLYFLEVKTTNGFKRHRFVIQ